MKFINLKAAVTVLLACAATVATAQTTAWPNKPIRIVNAGPAGSPPDTYARMYAEKMSKTLGVPIIVDNKPGAGFNIASDIVAKSPADGYTILYSISSAFNINPFIYPKLPFDPDKDLQPVAPLLGQGQFIVVNNALPVKTLAELIALAKSKPGFVNYGSYGTGTLAHLVMELISDSAKVTMTHVPYKAAVMTDVIGGQIQVLAEPAASAIPMIQTGKVRAIAFTGTKRHPQFPDVPTVAETYPGITAVGMHGIWAPAGVPKEIVARLNAEFVAATNSAAMTKRITELGSEPITGSPEVLHKLIKDDAKMWGSIIRAKNIKLD